MTKKSLISIPVIAAFLTMASCNETSTIGTSTTQDKVEVNIDSSFTIVARSVPIERVQSRTVTQLLGRIDAQGYGRLSSDIVTQFMPSSQITTENMTAENVDSLILYMYMASGNFVGDSLAPMGLKVYELTKELPSPIFSDFDPEGYYDPSQPIATKMYNIANQSSDTIMSGVYEIAVSLPTSMARRLFTAYVNDPASFLSPTTFSKNVFKGLYISNSYGSGRLMRISSSKMVMNYHHTIYDKEKGKDTTMFKKGTYFAVTPEIVTNSNVSLEVSPEIQKRVDAGEAIVQAPVGLEVEIEFPSREILSTFKSGSGDLNVLNSVTFTVPASKVENEFNFPMPNYLLLVLKKDADKFFANNKLPDNISSFYATYNEKTGEFNFGDMRPYFMELLKKDKITAEDYTFVITPVAATFENNSSSYYYTSQTLTLLTPYMAAPCMTKLDVDKARIVLTYSSQTIGK